MKISTLQENLKFGLNLVGHLAGKNINLPILNNILFEAKDGVIKLISTNLEIGITCQIRGKVEEEGSFTVNSKIVNDYISLLPNKKINLENSDKKLIVKSDNYNTIIKSDDAEEYPLIPQIRKDVFFKCRIKEFKKALGQTIFAVAGNESRVELSGVLFIFENSKLTIVATDSYRLAEKKIDMEANTEMETRIIIPVKTLQEVSRVLSSIKEETVMEKDSEIMFYVSDNQILFNIGTTEIISRIIEGQYPDYKQIIPINFRTEAVLKRDEFTRAIKAASIFSKIGINDINIDFRSELKQTIVSSSSSQSGENTTELESVITGGDNGMVLNYRYLLDGVNNVDTENIIIKTVDSNTPCIMVAEGDESYLYIVMPIRQ
jgi:DNA polymerase-3 subunit beta